MSHSVPVQIVMLITVQLESVPTNRTHYIIKVLAEVYKKTNDLETTIYLAFQQSLLRKLLEYDPS